MRFIFLCFFAMLISCRSTDKSSDKNLKETAVGNSGLMMKVPDNYTIRKKDGPDFTVYYITLTDTTKNPDYSGGIYIGSAPSEFPPTGADCQIDSLRSGLMGSERTWKKLYCDSMYMVQTIIDYKAGKMHAFGRTANEKNIATILDLFTSLH